MTPAALVERLRAAGCVFAEDEAAVLVEEAAGSDVRLEELAARRVAGEPLELVVGHVDFGGLRLAVAPGVFVPRQRTVLLADEAVRLAADVEGAGRAPVVVDLCCGAGAVGAVVAARVPAAVVHAADVDPAAVAVARTNLPSARVAAGDLFDALDDAIRGRVDVLAANAPYVPTEAIATMPPEARLFEGAVALDGGADGLDVQRRILTGAPAWLAPGGHVLIETSERQAATSAAAFRAAGLEGVRVVRDDERDATVVVGRRPARASRTPEPVDQRPVLPPARQHRVAREQDPTADPLAPSAG
ncbi:Peptide chain release factor N(5)-glutamine methyltransferase [Luteimicrobium xylanilyticum]|uniref:peptide chain release factor N(5)-glutamine methyltransferase n=1 Tax=Luteimicrobium xylanilyticum TaxID=1133546 RepID=A0A5P9Q8C7_9MICO|nr:putative protein N(5)-glutamine methyltransferase [Luteimicrobium xylanilyticum]QFU97691.1 Peptide chain release factor N(5)-glutamine methyltransferase [Luteimicrobium xylanilyticum]